MAYHVSTQVLAEGTRTQGRSRPLKSGYLLAPPTWKQSATSSESTLHQLAPYIGKLKSTIARDLIDKYSKPGDLIVDPFSGSGTIPLEGILAGRRVIASDVSSYAATLTRAKLAAPASFDEARDTAERLLSVAEARRPVDLRRVPEWVRRYFHPRTLKESIAFARTCRDEENDFLMACLLGILHHQRPGFLSYPSSHLVPYLRDRKFPRGLFPEMYAYRPLRERLLAKVERAFRRGLPSAAKVAEFRQVPVEVLKVPERFDAMITSPPYMNALDYGRDNRLRLWFLEEHSTLDTDDHYNSCEAGFTRQMIAVARLNSGLARDGRCVLVVGESVSRGQTVHPAQHVIALFQVHAPSLVLEKVIVDSIPDIRRARRDYRGVKAEQILVFRNAHAQ